MADTSKSTLRWLTSVGAGILFAAGSAVVNALLGLHGNAGPEGMDPTVATALGSILAFGAARLAGAIGNLFGAKPEVPPQ